MNKRKNKIFNTEDEMQKWLSIELHKNEGLMDIIDNYKTFSEYKPISTPEKKIFESFEYSLNSLYTNIIISENENISLKKGDSLKPDFLLYSPERETIVVVELKNLSGPSRQAGTEISAYTSEVKSYIPFLSDGDVVNVIISSVWPTLLRHYIYHEIFWLQKNLICLEPVLKDEKILLNIIDIKK